MEWNKETNLRFISFIRQRPAIWNTQSPEYKIKNKRHDAVKEVATLMGVSTKEVHAKWIILRNQFSREKRKMNGRGADSVYSTKWYAYKDMEALMSSNTPMLSINNCQENGSSVHSSPPPPQIPPPGTPSPPLCPPIAGLRKVEKMITDRPNSFYKEAEETFRVGRDRNKDSSQIDADDLTSFGIYIAAHLRKYSPHLQSKAKYEINTILYNLDMESLGPFSDPVVSVSSVGENDNYPFAPAYKSNRRFSTES